jgi:glycosyltransferase involved in cell wall biosynthesis
MPIPKERIAFFLPGLYEGGAERIVLNLAKGVAGRGYSADLVLARAEGPFMSQVPELVKVVDLKAARVLTSVPPLIHYLEREKPAALLSALFANVIALISHRLSGLPRRVVISEHNCLSSVTQNQADPRWQFYPKLAGWFYPWADEIIAVSNDVADDLARTTTIPRDRIQVVYNPVVTCDLRGKSEEALDHPWFKAGEPPVILSVGRLTAQKAFDLLIQAFSHVRKKRSVRLLILGEGEERKKLESLIRQLRLEQDVSLLGFVQNPYPYMAQAALFVLSSRWEGLPTVLIEALYLGIPIVATDCPGGSREILKGGKYGRLVPADHPQMLADSIEACLDSHLPHPSRESWESYDLDFVVDRYLELLLGV